MFMKRPAQNLNEYALVIGLVGVVSVGAMVMLGTNLNQQLGSTMDFGSPVGGTGNGAGSLALGVNTSPLPLPSAGSANLLFSNPDGSSFQLGNVPVDAATLVETVGTDGTLNQYGQMFESLASTLEENKQIDADTADLIRQMSNKAFNQANALSKILPRQGRLLVDNGVIQQAMGNYNEPAPFVIEDHLQQLRNYLNNPSPSQIQSANILKQPEIPRNVRDMLAIYNKLKEKPILDNPGIKDVLDKALFDITQISIRTGQAAILTNQGTAVNVRKFVSDNVEKTNKNSGQICVTHENNENTGIKCIQKG